MTKLEYIKSELGKMAYNKVAHLMPVIDELQSEISRMDLLANSLLKERKTNCKGACCAKES